MNNEPHITDGGRWQPVPDDIKQNGSSILGVYLLPNECVEWFFAYSPTGERVVTGYRIVVLP